MAKSNFKLQNYGLNRRQLAIACTSALVLVGVNLDWRLMLGAGTAVGTMAAVYGLQNYDWRRVRSHWVQLCRGENGRLIRSVLAGVATMLLVYVLLAIWQGQADHWLALVDSLELLASLGILGWLGYRLWQSTGVDQQILERLVLDLTSDHELQRLIALRQLGQCLGYASLEQELAIAEYCQVLLQSESCPAVRTAALELISLVAGHAPRGLPANSPTNSASSASS